MQVQVLTTPNCFCGSIAVGLQITESRNWNPACPEHGIYSEWWNSDEQVHQRFVRRQESLELQRRARIARTQRNDHP